MKLDFRGRKKKQGEANFCSLIPLMLFLTRQQRGKATGKSKVFSMHFILGTQLITRRQSVGESKEHVFQNLGEEER